MVRPSPVGRVSGTEKVARRATSGTSEERDRALKTRERFWRLFKARQVRPTETRRCTSGYRLIGVCRRRGQRFVPRHGREGRPENGRQGTGEKCLELLSRYLVRLDRPLVLSIEGPFLDPEFILKEKDS